MSSILEKSNLNKIFLVYGHLDDMFISKNLQKDNFRMFLNGYLKSLGYQQIVFYSGAKNLGKFVLDDESAVRVINKNKDMRESILGQGNTSAVSNVGTAEQPLTVSKGLIALPRIKGNNKYELLRFDEDIISICRDFQNKVGLKCPYNIQFKYLDGIPYFLEVNTRMSGGIQMACYASGVNIPQLALKKISGEELDWSCKYEEKILAQVLQPVTID